MESHSAFSRHMHILLQLVLKLSQCIREASKARDRNRETVGKRELMCEYWPRGGPCVDAGGKKIILS